MSILLRVLRWITLYFRHSCYIHLNKHRFTVTGIASIFRAVCLPLRLRGQERQGWDPGAASFLSGIHYSGAVAWAIGKENNI